MVRYRNGGGKYNHIAANAGESPNTDTGALIRSISTEITATSVFVGTSLEYAPWLEFGTIDMKPHPFLGKALVERQDDINKLFFNAVKGAMKGVLRVN